MMAHRDGCTLRYLPDELVFILVLVLFTSMEVLGRHHNNTIPRP